ncbi:MAG: ATP-binding protein [Vicinamibacterales bacterium]
MERSSVPWYLTATTLAAVPWLVRLRWMRAVVDLAVVAAALAFPQLDFPLRRLVPLLLTSAILHTVTAVRLGRGVSIPRPVATLDLLLQPAILTVLLELTGGPFNPFAVAYAIPIAQAAFTLGRAHALGVSAVSMGGYGLLALWHLNELAEVHHRLNDFPTHLFTVWWSITLMADLAAYFLVQASNALARREEQLEDMRRQTARNERLVSMTTLAAGAAHELSTPLGTIAVAARELERTALGKGTVPDLAEDARLIRAEVDRCRAILDQMSGRAGGSAVDEPEELSMVAVLDEVRGRVPREAIGRLRLAVEPERLVAFLPRSGVVQAVLSLVMNGLDANEGTSAVVDVRVRADAETLTITVEDPGPGLSADVLKRAGEPFFTTKDPGRGLGLGLFLARAFAERVGGSLVIRTGERTSVTLSLPVRMDAGSEMRM